MKKITLLLVALAVITVSKAQPFMGLYTFDSVKTTSGTTDPSPVPVATGVTFGSFSATGTPTNPNAAARFSFTNWPTGSVSGFADSLYSNMTGSLSASEYYEVTVAPASGYTISLDSIRFTVRRSPTGIRSFAVRSSADGYANNLSASYMVARPWLSIQGTNEFFFRYDTTAPPPFSIADGSLILLSSFFSFFSRLLFFGLILFLICCFFSSVSLT